MMIGFPNKSAIKNSAAVGISGERPPLPPLENIGNFDQNLLIVPSPTFGPLSSNTCEEVRQITSRSVCSTDRIDETVGISGTETGSSYKQGSSGAPGTARRVVYLNSIQNRAAVHSTNGVNLAIHRNCCQMMSGRRHWRDVDAKGRLAVVAAGYKGNIQHDNFPPASPIIKHRAPCSVGFGSFLYPFSCAADAFFDPAWLHSFPGNLAALLARVE